MKLKKHRLLFAFVFLGYGFLYLPIAILVLFSFNQSKSIVAWNGFSLRWYKALFNNDVILKALWYSLKIGIITAIIATVIGVLAAVIMVKLRNFKTRGFFNSLVTAPLIMPDVILGLSLLIFFSSTYRLFGIPESNGFYTIIIGHTTMAIAYVILIVRSRLLEFDHTLEEAALDLGAKPAIVFLKITLPNILPAIISGALLSFTLSFDDVVLASFLNGSGVTTLPMVIFSSIRRGVRPEINALSTIFLTIIAIGVIMSAIFMHKKNRRLK